MKAGPFNFIHPFYSDSSDSQANFLRYNLSSRSPSSGMREATRGHLSRYGGAAGSPPKLSHIAEFLTISQRVLFQSLLKAWDILRIVNLLENSESCP